MKLKFIYREDEWILKLQKPVMINGHLRFERMNLIKTKNSIKSNKQNGIYLALEITLIN